MKQMMKRLGMEMDELDDVEAVIIKCRTKDIVITNPSVTIMDVKGQKSYQVTGDEEVVTKGEEGEEEEKAEIPQEDIDLVASQANVSEEEALKALVECDGNPAEAIIKLMSNK
jgi:nascent polypeptide-associated complex subunit alpha